MRTVLAGTQEQAFKRPEGLIQVEVCSLSGLLPTAACPYRRIEWFIPGTEPVMEDNLYKEIFLDAATDLLADENTPVERRLRKVVLDLPSEADSWAHSEGISLLSDYMDTATAYTETAPVRMVSPDPNATFYLTPKLPAEVQKIRVASTGGAELRETILYVDGVEVGRCVANSCETWWTIEIGDHQAWASGVTVKGEVLESEKVRFTVR